MVGKSKNVNRDTYDPHSCLVRTGHVREEWIAVTEGHEQRSVPLPLLFPAYVGALLERIKNARDEQGEV